ncbi:MAG: hypothetical protein LUO97_01685 [Methanomicrobiales archaeon]|nr:hypothetical protein [Methanomicrobiales archaeon]
MQLPRGKFRSVIKGVALHSLIQELAEVRYTGVITITWRHEVITLVIQKGRYILAEFGPLKGDPAWEGMIALGETTIDAILSDFSDAELKLANEFNDACLLSAQAVPRLPKVIWEKPREPAPVERRPERPPQRAPERPPDRLARAVPPPPPEPPLVKKSAPATAATEMAPGEEREVPGVYTQADMAQAIAVTADQGGTDIPPPGGYDELALLHMEMSALDDVDVEHIATKIRKNARGIVKKLHLGHLMAEKEE